jgi:enamine deaminase RidA (YjgF/YER057c/UK114 family)
VRPEHVFKVLIAISLFFFAVTLFERIWEQSHSNLGGLGVRFDTHEEGNLPTWFSGAMLLAAAGLFLLIAAARRAAGEARTGRWTFLGAVFVYLAADEVGQIHEHTVKPLKHSISDLTGFGGSAARAIAVAVIVVVLLAFAAAYWPWLRAQPRRLSRLIVLAGVLYVTGALGLEVVGRVYEVAGGGRTDLFDGVLSTVEEVLEMIGVAILVYALLERIAGVRVELAGDEPG